MFKRIPGDWPQLPLTAVVDISILELLELLIEKFVLLVLPSASITLTV